MVITESNFINVVYITSKYRETKQKNVLRVPYTAYSKLLHKFCITLFITAGRFIFLILYQVQ